MDMIKARDLLISSCESRLKDQPIHKRLAVMRYMQKVIRDIPDYLIEEAIQSDTGKGYLPDDLIYRLDLASERYDNWMAKHNRVATTKEEKAQARQRLKAWADSGMPAIR